MMSNCVPPINGDYSVYWEFLKNINEDDDKDIRKNQIIINKFCIIYNSTVVAISNGALNLMEITSQSFSLNHFN